MKSVFGTITVILILRSGAYGSLLFSHVGNVDPTLEGWSIGGSLAPNNGVGIVVGPITNDAGSGLDAWFVDDTSNAVSSNQSYFQTPTSGEVADGNTLGWILSTTIRIPDASVTAAASPFLLYRDGTRSWDIYFGSDADSDPVVLLPNGGGAFPNFSGLSFTIEGAGATYHTFDLIYDPIATTADLYIDGVERLSDYAGISLVTSPGVGWGSGSSADIGQGNFNTVQFSIVPEPRYGVALFILVALGFGFQRYRIQRRAASETE
ncbi:MAG: hypothetical protein AAF733_08985 [Verrucomicrobiota bacterium]